jgi:SOS-response transcriptional repressor LexA
MKPTKKQQQILDYIDRFRAEQGVAPTYREIMFGLGYSSVATIAEHIRNLTAKGLLLKEDFAARSVAVPRESVLEVDFMKEIAARRAREDDPTAQKEAKTLQEAWQILTD